MLLDNYFLKEICNIARDYSNILFFVKIKSLMNEIINGSLRNEYTRYIIEQLDKCKHKSVEFNN